MCELFSCFESSMPNWANNPSYYKCIYCKYLHPYEFLWVAIMYIYVRKAFFVPCLRCLFEVTICWASVCLAAASMRIQAMYNLRIIFLNYTERTWECTKSVSTLWDQQLPWSDYTSSWNTNKVYSLNLSMKTKHLINSRSVTCGESLGVFIWLWNPVKARQLQASQRSLNSISLSERDSELLDSTSILAQFTYHLPNTCHILNTLPNVTNRWCHRCKPLWDALNVTSKSILNVGPAFFFTKPFVYNSVAICLIMIKLLHHTV